MSTSRPLFPIRVTELLQATIAASRDGWPPAGAETFRLIERALMKPHAGELATAFSGARHRVGGDDWLEISVQPHADFRSPGYERGSAVDVAFNLKSHRLISSAAPSARIGFCDLAAHVWALQAPAERVSAERRLLALIGLAYLKSLIEPQPKLVEAA
jgi:hypothetical protein